VILQLRQLAWDIILLSEPASSVAEDQVNSSSTHSTPKNALLLDYIHLSYLCLVSAIKYLLLSDIN